MQDPYTGWAWFDLAPDENEHKRRPGGISADILDAYVRTFGSECGSQVMRHLRAITSERALGPHASEALLRHLEGQRQLVKYISILAGRVSD